MIGNGPFFLDLAHGRRPGLEGPRGYQSRFVVLPPFPFDDEETYDENSRNAAVVFESDSREGIHIEDAKRVDEQWRVAGESGMPLVVTGKGVAMQAAREQAYNASMRPYREPLLPRRRRALDRRRRGTVAIVVYLGPTRKDECLHGLAPRPLARAERGPLCV